MLNYLSAEFWRMFRRKSACVGWLFFLVLVGLTGLAWRGSALSEVSSALENFMVMGLYLAFPLADWACGGGGWEKTLGNEVSFGLSRVRIYFGKLWAALLAGLILLLLTAVVFLGAALSPAVLMSTSPDSGFAARASLFRAVLISLPRYVGAVALAHMLLFSLRPTGAGAVIYYLYVTLGELTLAAIRPAGLGAVGEAVCGLSDRLRPFLLSSAYFVYGSSEPTPGVADSWLAGAGWFLLTAGAGLALLRRRELR